MSKQPKKEEKKQEPQRAHQDPPVHMAAGAVDEIKSTTFIIRDETELRAPVPHDELTRKAEAAAPPVTALYLFREGQAEKAIDLLEQLRETVRSEPGEPIPYDKLPIMPAGEDKGEFLKAWDHAPRRFVPRMVAIEPWLIDLQVLPETGSAFCRECYAWASSAAQIQHRDSCAHEATQRVRIVKALGLLCQAKVTDRLEPALREVVTDLTEGSYTAALKLRLGILADATHDEKIKQALEVLE